jgi:Glyoxalase-like domain
LEPVAHFSRLYKAVIDVPADDYDSELSFWEGALGQPMSPLPHPEYHGTELHSQDFCLLTQRLGEGTAGVHLDIHTSDLDAEVARLERLGAKCVQRVHSWQIMRDPAGLLFCVLQDRPGALHDGNAHRWP